MTEETIEKMISDWYLSTPRDISELSEQLLEQHEAEMVEFTDWVDDNKYFKLNYEDWYGGNDESGIYFVAKTTTDLLTLFKNRNK